MADSVLPASDPRSPFHVSVPPADAKPVNHLVAYFKLWKHFIHALIAYLKDLVLAKEFDLNLMVQLIGSIQFPGSRDLAYKTISVIEAAKTNPASPGSNTHPCTPGVRPGLPKQKSQTSYFKNQTFAHKRTNSAQSMMLDAASINTVSSKKPPKQESQPQHPVNTILAAKYAPKSDVLVDPTYFPPNSLFHNLSGALVNHHLLIYTAQTKLVKDVQGKLIPRLEHLHRNLGIKIKEIKSSLKNESFANPGVVKEVSKTGAVLNDFITSIRRYTGPRPLISKGTEEEENDESLNDPFLIKLSVDHQLKSQLVHENYVYASYVNLQNISRDLLNYVVKDLNAVADRLSKLVSAESVYASSVEQGLYNLAYTLRTHLNSAETEWEFFISNNPNFLNVYKATPTNPRMMMRTLQDIVLPYSSSLHCKCLRCGIMYKKQKVLKLYTSHFYLLTCNYLHEFRLDNMADRIEKISDVSGTKKERKERVQKKKKGKIGGIVGHDDTPVKSYNLNNYAIQLKSEKDFKFTLTKALNALQKFTFKCQSEEDFAGWFTDLHDLLKFNSNHLRRFAYIEERMLARENHDHKEKEETKPKKEMNLNLSGLMGKNGSNPAVNAESLSGMFTPRLQSPSEVKANGKQENPFENTFSDLAAPAAPAEETKDLDRPSSESPAPSEPQPPQEALAALEIKSPEKLSEPTLLDSPAESAVSQLSSPDQEQATQQPDAKHQEEHENYLRLQEEILKQQQKLLDLKTLLTPKTPRHSLSRQSSNESMVSMLEQSNNDLVSFLSNNKDIMDKPPAAAQMYSQENNSLVPQVFVLSHEND